MFGRLSHLFVFSRKERRGVILLLVSMFLIWYLWYSTEINANNRSYDYKSVEAQISQIHKESDVAHKQFDKSITVPPSGSDKKQITPAATKPPYAIDPNHAAIEDWEQLGFSPKQAKVILNYKSKGAVFHDKKDLLKLFVIDDSKLEEIAPYIKIKPIAYAATNNKLVESKVKSSLKRDTSGYSKPIVIQFSEPININTADTTMLKKINYIGSFYAKSIVKFRSMTGGYVSLDQLDEVYGLKDNVKGLKSLRMNGYIDPEDASKININTCTKEDLASHYYIRWSVANALISYREMHGNFQQLEDVMKSDLVSEELYSKIVPYLIME